VSDPNTFLRQVFKHFDLNEVVNRP
jgi:hypothetical protein